MSGQPREHVRLLRAFDIPLTRVGTAVWMTGVMGLLGLAAPAMLIPAGGVVAGLGGIAAADRRAIAKGLREVDAFGFPVEGYRAWLLAESPTFDIELDRDLDIEVLRTSTAAVDSTIVVEKRSDRVFRFVMRRIGLPNTRAHLPPIQVGDRRALKQLHARILAPLHADIGIVAMRMGDGGSLAALVPRQRDEIEPATSSGGMGAFRDAALAAPPALQALVHVGGDRAMPHEARRLKNRSLRVMHAVSSSPSGVGMVAAFTLGGVTSAAQFGPEAIMVGGLAGMVTGIATAIGNNRRNARRVAEAVADAGFPIEGYDDWLLSGRPLFDVETTLPIPRDWFSTQIANQSAWSVQKQALVQWVENVTWFSDTEVRLETRPSYIQPPTSRIDPFYGGSHDMFRKFMVEVLSQVHAQCEIRVVRMGGYIDRRI